MRIMAENAGPLIEKEIIEAIRSALKQSIEEFRNHMEQFMKDNDKDPEI